MWCDETRRCDETTRLTPARGMLRQVFAPGVTSTLAAQRSPATDTRLLFAHLEEVAAGRQTRGSTSSITGYVD